MQENLKRSRPKKKSVARSKLDPVQRFKQRRAQREPFQPPNWSSWSKRQAEIDTSIAKTLSSAAKSSAKLAVIAEKKIVALERLAEFQRLAANNQIMCTNVEVLNEVAREYLMLQKRRIIRDLRQQEQEIESAQAVTMAMDPELISLAEKDADAPSVALEEELEGV
ncbi:unnamed protein product [Albugo candida]|uniref:No apical meristem-associated C-terminal domain-containing protein n=1 Tax=Albugo candida TaxID=65357 RepID=A0A024GB70_9STRA|nr:unnamed protein product [Albugo candida]|eukprot:CCI44008.1 unnamed protein product [Albugo candida]